MSTYDKKNKNIIIINSNETTENMHLLWKDTPVSFEENNLKDIRNLVQTGKLYFMIDKITCSKNKTDIGIICINAKVKYEFELLKSKDKKETLRIVQETDDILPSR
ncbi:hypothetical protein ACFOWA_12990 [Pedobacter lithocola]|uniref:Uncharacterized protein n=1 Tax=Pedobacter lithocola TaxID=1908239 RepID=A0ABV8PA03_9SPHI